MAAERGFQAAAKGGAVNRRDNRFAGRFEAGDDIVQPGGGRGHVKLTDIGPGDESTAGADNHDGGHRRVGEGGPGALRQSGAYRLAEGVDGRIIDCDDGDITVVLNTDRHVVSPPPMTRRVGGGFGFPTP